MAIIDFRKNADKLFSKVFYQIQAAKTDYVVVKGGSGSSKSYSVHQNELLKIMTATEGDTLVFRKHGADLRDSCYALFNNLINDWNLRPFFKSVYGNQIRRITYMPTGRSIILRGLDDSEKIKSIVGIKRVVLEEASEFELSDWMEILRRARGFEDIQFTLILNPISENHWIKKYLCDADGPYFKNATVFSFNYKDNVNVHGKPFLTEKDIERLENLKNVDENQYNIYVLGLWGIDNKEGKFCWAFSNSQIKKTSYNQQHILWASFDFNVDPMTCTIAQVFPHEQRVAGIECIKLQNSDVYAICDRILAKYPYALFHVTGDASGRSRSPLAKDNITAYGIICQKLNISPQQLIVPSVNPSIEDNRIVVNAVHQNWIIELDPDNCAHLIYDLRYVEVNGRGEIMKDRTSAKKFADFLDNWRYLINAAVRPHLLMR